VEETKIIEVKIEPGVEEGEAIVIPGGGDEEVLCYDTPNIED